MENHSVIPNLLKRIIDWEREIRPEVSYLETPSSLYLKFNERENGGYMCSPADSIMFAGTGADGVHYSLLTDFGKTTNMEEAPVIRVSPMNFGDCVKIVAKNIRDFFALSFYGHEDLLFSEFETEEAYLRHKEEEEKDQTTEYFDHKKWKKQKLFVGEKAIMEFQLEPIVNPYAYIQKLREERAKNIVLRTKDGLGVIPISQELNNKLFAKHPWAGRQIPERNSNEVSTFVEQAELETLLSFVRDYQEEYVTNVESLHIICRQLKTYGLHQESIRLLQCMNQ